MKKLELTDATVENIIAAFPLEGNFKQFTLIHVDSDMFAPFVKRGYDLLVQKLERIPNGSLTLMRHGDRLFIRKFFAYPLGVVLMDPVTNTPDFVSEDDIFDIPVEPLAMVCEIREP